MSDRTHPSPFTSPRVVLDASGAPFETENLELASTLSARGHRLIGTVPYGKLIAFQFAPSAEADVPAFFSGGLLLPPLRVFEAHRTLRSLIATLRNTRRSGGVA